MAILSQQGAEAHIKKLKKIIQITEVVSGLGLTIVKYIIEAHNEKIFVESNLGKGSQFSFTLQKQIEFDS